MENKKEKFLRVYKILPYHEKSNVIAVIDDETYSWNVAHKEVLNDTDIGKNIVKYLTRLEIL